MNRKPQLEDFYDSSDPRGCSSSEYAEYESALNKWEKTRAENEVPTEEGVDEDNDSYSPYCEICTSCGETGCCSPVPCQQHPDGKYCEGNLNELKFGYLMFKDLYSLIFDLEDEKLREKLDKIYDENWDLIYNDNVGESNGKTRE